MEMNLCYDLIDLHPISTQFSTCHNKSTHLACEKFAKIKLKDAACDQLLILLSPGLNELIVDAFQFLACISSLTHSGLVTKNGNIKLGWYWLR